MMTSKNCLTGTDYKALGIIQESRETALYQFRLSSVSKMDSMPMTNNVPGKPLTTKSMVLETGASLTQVLQDNNISKAIQD